MTVATTHSRDWTDDELMALPDDGKSELVDGEVLSLSDRAADLAHKVAEYGVLPGFVCSLSDLLG
jgi:hypothetical protein